MALYPFELPDPNRSGFAHVQKSNTLRSKVDVGEAKTRRRYTLPIFDEKWTLILTPEQVQLFVNWFNNDLASGTLRFQYTDPISNTVEDYRITDMYTLTPYGTCGSYTSSFNVERLP